VIYPRSTALSLSDRSSETRVNAGNRDNKAEIRCWSHAYRSGCGLAGFEKDAIRELDPIYNLRMAGYNVARLALIGKWYLLEREKSRRSMKRPNQTLKSVLRIPGHRITFHGTLAH